MIAPLYRFALQIFRRLPVRLRRTIIRSISPSFTIGAMCFIERADGALLLVRHSYRARWGVPGGLLKKGEGAQDGARREVREEVGAEVHFVGEPAVVVDAKPQRVDVIYRCRLDDSDGRGDPIASSPEIVEVGWFPPDGLPELQFETAGALVALARTSTRPAQRPLPDPVWPLLD